MSKHLLSPPSSKASYSWWAVFTTAGAFLSVGYFLSRQWWFGHPVPIYFWGGEVALIALFTAGLWWLAWDERRAQPSRPRQWVQQATRHPSWLWVWGWVVWLSLGMALTPSSFWIGNFRAAVWWQHSLLLWFWLVWAGSRAWFIGWKRQGGFLRRPRLTGVGVFLAMLALWGAAALLVVVTGLGWRVPHYWQGIGVPILSGQIWLLLTLLGGGITLGRWLPARWWKLLKSRDTAVVLALWALTFGIWWWSTPAPAYFQPSAFPPNYQRYPFSDAERYGLAGEQAVLGYGYFATKAMPRGSLDNTHLGLAGLLALIQVWAKTTSTVTFVLVLLLSLTPALLYLLGGVAHSRSVGLLLAGVEILRERNAIVHADLFHVTSHVHMWTTEPLTREIFVLLALTALIFLQRPWQRKPWLFAVGALTALGFLVRRENLVLMALSLLLVVPVLFSKERLLRRVGKAAALTGILIAGMAAVLTPWVARNEALALRLPYARQPVSGVRVLFLKPIETVLSPNFRADVFAETEPTPPPTASTPVPTATPPQPKPSQPSSKAPATLLDRLSQWHEGLLLAVGDLFARNLLALALAFPPLLRFYPTLLVVREKTPLWTQLLSSSWYHLSWETTALLTVQGLALALGMAVLWRKRREAVWLPLGMMVFYLGASAAARDAGGRYVVPLDWVLPLFATVGWITLMREGAAMLGGNLPPWLQAPLDLKGQSQRLARAAWGLGSGIALLSWAMVALEFGAMGWVAYSGQAGAATWPTATPPRWQPTTSEEFLTRLDLLQVWDELPWSRQEVQQALESHKVFDGWGFLFYPRYVLPTEKCGGLCGHSEINSPHLFFAGLLGGQGQMRFRMPLATSPPPLRDGSEMLVLYCKPSRCHIFHCAEAVAMIQVTHPEGAPPQGEASVFLPPQPNLTCSPQGDGKK